MRTLRPKSDCWPATRSSAGSPGDLGTDLAAGVAINAGRVHKEIARDVFRDTLFEIDYLATNRFGLVNAPMLPLPKTGRS
jgi:hypothetical protein